jgi:hypothetical protein
VPRQAVQRQRTITVRTAWRHRPRSRLWHVGKGLDPVEWLIATRRA